MMHAVCQKPPLKKARYKPPDKLKHIAMRDAIACSSYVNYLIINLLFHRYAIHARSEDQNADTKSNSTSHRKRRSILPLHMVRYEYCPKSQRMKHYIILIITMQGYFMLQTRKCSSVRSNATGS